MTDEAAKWVLGSAMASEYDAKLGDSRRRKRARQVGVAIAHRPGLSFPKCFCNEADLEGFYRFVENEDVDWRELLGAHVAQSVRRASSLEEVLVVHDTTEIRFRKYWPDELRQRMTSFSTRNQGLLAHMSLAVTSSGPVLPVGLLAMQPFVHAGLLNPHDVATRAFWLDEGGLFDNESERWFRAIEQTQSLLAASGARAIHVMDREGDNVGLLMWMLEQGISFVVRGQNYRRWVEVSELREVGVVDVQLNEVRPHSSAKDDVAHPPRRARSARLTIRAGTACYRRKMKENRMPWSPGTWSSLPRTARMQLVEAIEQDPPAGQQPVRWLLVTNEPAESADEILRIVDIYRRRWLIEEYFKALKSGCRLEERQVESVPVLLRVLALLVPAAWRLLVMRRMTDDAPDASWQLILTTQQFQLLARAVPNARLRVATATAQQCLLAIAKLGGHLPRNGPPGWQSLHAGWRRLDDFRIGAELLAGDAINP